MKKLLFSAFAMSLVLFASCDKEDDAPNNQFVVVADDLKGTIPAGDNITLDASKTYTLTGILTVASGATLNIPAGTVIKANSGFGVYLMVLQGGKLMAQGTSAKPIKFTSSATTPAAGDWGGVILNGYAPISGATAGTTGLNEVDNLVVYGGTDAADNSGVLKYVIIEYAGARSSAEVEHNGLSLYGVGNGTTIDNIYIPYSADDAIEWFGGSVNVSNLLAVNPDDDMFDCTQGWKGTLTNAYGTWKSGYASTEADPRGIEADGNFDGNGPDHVGQSDFTMTKVSIVNNSTYVMEDGIKIRRGAKATISNCLVQNGSAKDLIDFTDSKGISNNASSVSLTRTNVTLTGSEVKRTITINAVDVTCSATATVAAGNTGADTSVFGWTGFTF
jgi:hypothetical protein